MRDFLRHVTWRARAAATAWPVPRQGAARSSTHELGIINRLGFAGYFLIVWDIVRFCEEHDILVQGRGSAANSAVCYCLGITAADAVGQNLLFERFLSEGRQGWPDIDLDLPSSERREQRDPGNLPRYGRERRRHDRQRHLAIAAAAPRARSAKC